MNVVNINNTCIIRVIYPRYVVYEKHRDQATLSVDLHPLWLFHLAISG